MSAFLELLRERGALDREPARWAYVPYDQLSDRFGPWSRDPDIGLVFVESRWKAARRPYHKQKLAFLLSNQRHFALEQANAGRAVRVLAGADDYASQLRAFIRVHGAIVMMEAAERELRANLAPLVEDGAVVVVPHEGWLTTDDDFAQAGKGGPPWRMDAFYRAVRKRTGFLMDADGKPIGGRYSFDGENRKRWPGEPAAPVIPRFEVDAITQEVGALVERWFGDHPGSLDLAAIPCTAEAAQEVWGWAAAKCLVHFGPYEDAMSVERRNLFHTRLSPLLNVHRLLPGDVVDDVLRQDLPLPSQEGFLRQVIGWREFVRHVHRATDGFRSLPDGPAPQDALGQAAPSYLGSERPLPPVYWGNAPSGLHCLDSVVDGVWAEGMSHHITRLMVLSNLATLLDVSPRALTDWFWEAYIDAYDWVVEPNVLAMGSFGVGDLMTTKPYVAGAAYIHRMSDYCDACAFHPKKNCPITPLYWAFLGRHRDALEGNHRIAMPLRSEARRKDAQKKHDRRCYERVSGLLADGGRLTPDALDGDE